MAKPITNIKTDPNANQEEVLQEMDALLRQVAESRKAIQESLAILSELQETGILDAAKALLTKRTDIGGIAMEQMNQPGAHHIIKNGISAVGFLASIEPNQLEPLLGGLTKGLQYAAEPNEVQGTIGVFGIYKAMKDPNVNTAIQMLFRFLEGMGKQLNETAKEPPQRTDKEAETDGKKM